MYIDQLDDIVNKYNNTYHSTIKIKPVDVKPSTYIDSSQEINDKDPELNIGDIVIISTCKNIFPKDCAPNWTQEVFVIEKVKNTVPCVYVINDLNGKGIVGMFYKKKKQKKKIKIKKEFRVEKVIKTKGDMIICSKAGWIDENNINE